MRRQRGCETGRSERRVVDAKASSRRGLTIKDSRQRATDAQKKGGRMWAVKVESETRAETSISRKRIRGNVE